MSSIIANPQFGTTPLPMRKFTVAEYHRMIETGILTAKDDVELLEGWVVARMPRKPPHDVGVELARGAVGSKLPASWSIRGQSAITTDDSEPEPDIAVVRGEPRAYRVRHPGPADIGVLIEIADTTLAYDRREKGRIYAHAGLPYYWIVNLVDACVEVYTDPDSIVAVPSYRTRTDHGSGQHIPLVLDGQTVAMIAVADLLP
jgi:Uma2 family endonuclease